MTSTLLIEVDSFCIEMTKDGNQEIRLRGRVVDYWGDKKIEAHVRIHKNEKQIFDIIDNIIFLKSSNEHKANEEYASNYTSWVKNELAEGAGIVDGICTLHDLITREDDGQSKNTDSIRNQLFAIDTLLPQAAWDKIHDKLCLSPHLKIQMTVSINQGYRDVLEKEGFCSVYGSEFAFFSANYFTRVV